MFAKSVLVQAVLVSDWTMVQSFLRKGLLTPSADKSANTNGVTFGADCAEYSSSSILIRAGTTQ